MISYRGDIDGLRAVAVVMVVLFHFIGAPFANGYAGVDVFFVISGYLITAIIARDMQDGRFSLVSFYERRARRIMPALTVMLAASAIATYLLFLPTEMLAFAKSLVGATTFASNFVFWQEAGYFDMEAVLKPLLHTWSLAVEEQFYIVYPLLLAALYKWMPRRVRTVLLTLLALSFTANVALVYTDHHDASFYLFPMRAWELLVGGVLALGVPTLSSTRMKWIGWSALILLSASFAIEFSETKFPGFYALGPVLGAALAIYAGQGQSNGFLTSCLQLPVMRFIGKISYSLYLWHWPVYVFAGYMLLGDIKPPHIAAMIVASFGLAWLSWRFIEQPWRRDTAIFTRRIVFTTTLASMIALLAVGTFIWTTDGARYKFDAAILRLSETKLGGDYKPAHIDTLGDKAQLFVEGKPPVVAVWGDSHAEAIAPAIEALVENGILVNGNDCIMPDAIQSHIRYGEECMKRTEAALAYFEANRDIKTVVLAGRWAEHLRFWYKHDYTREEAIALRLRAFETVIKRLRKAGKRVLIVAQVPQVVAGNDAVPSLLARIQLHGLNVDLRPRRDAYEAAQLDMQSVYAELDESYPDVLIRPDAILCEEDVCAIQRDGVSLYYDDDHLSRAGAQRLSPLFEGKL